MSRTRSGLLHTRSRRARFEQLESRQLLSITLPTIATQSLSAGAPLSLPLDATESDGHAVSYTVSVSNAYMANASVTNPQLTTTVPQGNPSLRITVDYTGTGVGTDTAFHGDLVFQLNKDLTPAAVQQITNLVNDTSIRGKPFYEGLTFHRIIENFMVQGGDPAGNGSGGPGFAYDDQFNATLQFTGPGILALANSGSDTNGSQFFVTTDPYRYGDFRYTIVGFLTEGYDILTKIENVPKTTAGGSTPASTVTIAGASIFTDTQNGVLRLSVPNGTTGYADVTVTAKDTFNNETASRTFHMTVAPDTSNGRPFLGTVAPIHTTVNTAASIDLTATDVEGDAVYYDGVIPTEFSANLTLTIDNSTGHVTVTPKNGVAGVYAIDVGVRQSTVPEGDQQVWDTQLVPVYIHPAAPTAISLLAASDTGGSTSDRLTNLNNTAGKTLQFQVTGVLSDAEVQLFADGQLIGTTTATGTTATITTNGTVALADGAHSITAKQTLKNQTVAVGNLNTKIDLASEASAVLTVTVDTVVPVFSSTPVTSALTGLPYTYQATANAETTGAITYQLLQNPTGMTINGQTGLISWTPAVGQGPTVNVSIQATDAAGNMAQQLFTIDVVPLAQVPPEITVLSGMTPITNGQMSAVAVGSAVRGTTGPSITITIRNDGGQPLDLTTPIANTTHFTVSQPSVTTLAHGDTTTFTVTLNTGAVWTGTEQIALGNNDADNGDGAETTFAIPISGTVTAMSPEITVLDGTTSIVNGQTAAIDLGSANRGAASPTKTFTIRNDGDQPLTLTAPFVSSSHFTVETPAVTTLAAGATTTFKVTLKTDAIWSGSEQISFGNNDADNGDGVESPFTFTVSGTVAPMPAEITVLDGTTVIDSGSANSISVRSVILNATGPSKTYTIRNDGDETLTLTTPFADTDHFTVSQPAKTSLALGETTTFTVTLKTDTAWSGTEQVSFVNNDANNGDGVESPFTFQVSGEVVERLQDFSTIGVYDPSTSAFFLKNTNISGYADEAFGCGLGSAGWIGISGDWDGDGVDTIGLYDPANATFLLRNSNTGGYADMTFMFGPGNAGWLPITGDWDGDNIDTIGLYNPTAATFFLRNSNTSGYADMTFEYGPGNTDWKPMAGDWDADGTDTIGLYSPTAAGFFLRNSNTSGYADVAFGYGPGNTDWRPTAGDWDGDTYDSIGLYNPATSTFFLRNSNTGGYADASFDYGAASMGWMPLAGDWNGLSSPLKAAEEPASALNVPALTQNDLQPIVSEAIARWTAAGLDAATLAKLEQVQVVIGDLPSSTLGLAEANRITIDRNAAGHGWFVDSTPALDDEFSSPQGSRQSAVDPRAVDRIDLLTVVEHELGHIAGLDDLDVLADDVMSGVLGTGVRRNVG